MGGGTYAINNLEILFLLKIFTSQGNASSPPLLVIRISHWHAQPYRTFGKKGGMGPNPEEDKTCSPWGRTFQGPGLSKRGATPRWSPRGWSSPGQLERGIQILDEDWTTYVPLKWPMLEVIWEKQVQGNEFTWVGLDLAKSPYYFWGRGWWWW